MQSLFPFLDPFFLVVALGIAFCAGFVKGVVGFAMPLVMISGLTFFLSPELALAGLILPTLCTNIFQASRQGLRAAWASLKAFRLFLVVGGVAMVAAAQLVLVVPQAVLECAIGVPAVVYSILQLRGIEVRPRRAGRWFEPAAATITGVMGGLSGVWGPPTVMYLTALDTPKHDQLRIQGIFFGLGAVVLVAAHLGSGVLRAETVPFSALMILPAFIGMWVGGKVVDRIDQVMFKRATLIVLLIAGANLIRRALF